MRNADGTFARGNTFAARTTGNKGRPIGSLGALNKEMIERVKQEGDRGRHVDSLLFDIAFDDAVSIETRLKALNKLADILYTKNAALVVEDEKKTMSNQQLNDRLQELLSLQKS